MGSQCFEVTESDHIAHIVLNRPDELNTMTPDFWAELPQLVDEISNRGVARVIVLSSTGRHFCAGMDISCLLYTSDAADD